MVQDSGTPAPQETTTPAGAPQANSAGGTGKKTPTGKVLVGIVGLCIVWLLIKSIGSGGTPGTPDEVSTRMMRTMGVLKSGEFTGTLEVDVKSDKNPLSALDSLGQAGALDEGSASSTEKPVVVSVGFSGAVDIHDINKPKSSLKFTLNSPDFPSGQSAEIEFRSSEGQKYFKLNKVPIFGKLDLISLTNTWVNLDTQALKEQLRSPDEDTPTPTTTTALSDDKKEKIRNIITSSRILEVVEDMGDAKVGGVTVYHYKVRVNESEVVRIAKEMYEVKEGKVMSAEDEKKLTDEWARIEVKNGEVWIGKKDFYLYGLSADVVSTKVGTEGSDGSFGIDVEMRNFDKPVTVEVPQNPSSITTFVGQIFGIIIGQSLTESMGSLGR